ncbi:hypothetical protein ABPG72_015957 [Tetrahymena utriculariae]
MKKVLLGLFLGLFLLSSINTSVNLTELQNAISIQQGINWAEVHNNTWYYPPYLGEMFISEYYFELLVLNWTHKSAFNATYFTERLLQTQFEDGSWEQVREQNLVTGLLDATVFNYWYLKSINNNPKIEAALQKARKWIVAQGGIEATQTMTKFKLAAFGQYSWEDLWYVPLFIFKQHGIFKYTYVKDIIAQWVYPHLTALAYLRYQRTVFNVAIADLRELWVNYPKNGIKINPREYSTLNPDSDLLILMDEIFKLKQPLGSFGAYTISTLLTLMSFKDFQSKHPHLYQSEIQKAYEDGYYFVEFNYFNFREAYHGSLDDGRWWDTILISWAMLESGQDKERIFPIVQNMVKEGLQPKKGIGYGYDFEYAPDTDDTGLLLVVMSYYKEAFQKQIPETIEWLFSMQNDDGGYPAFDKGKNEDNLLFKFAFNMAGIANSAEIFDPSCPDITGHIMEGLGEFGYQANHPKIQNMIKYQRKTQNKWGSWQARWGVNYIMAVGAVVPGLARVNYDLNEQWVQNSINYLLIKQNKDGGFGECVLSYNDPEKWNGIGKSTVTQTSWGLLALLEVYNQNEQIKNAADRAAQYLLDQFKRDGNTFFDHSTIGTGHRGLLYLQYPSYAQSFPLVALNRYQKISQGQYHFSKNLYNGNGEPVKKQDI